MKRATASLSAPSPDDRNVKMAKLESYWDIREKSHQVFQKLQKLDKGVVPALQMIDELGCPIAKTTRPFDGERFFRPVGHARSFCLRLGSGGCLVFKGSEPMSDDYAETFRDAYARRPWDKWSRIDHFILLENEIYLALTKAGTLFCANQSLGWTESFLKAFRRLPNTPIPLMVMGLDSEESHRFLKKLRPYAGNRGQLSAQERLNHLAREGLGIYVYYYPSIPYRAAHVKGDYPGSDGVGTSGPNLRPVDSDFDVEKAINGWLKVTAEMLVAGYLPTTSVHTGSCMQVQNLAIDGGLCDIDSLEKMENFANERDFHAALFYSIAELVDSIDSFCGLGESQGAAVWHFVWSELRRHVQSLSKKHKCDKRLLGVFEKSGIDFLAWVLRLK